MWIFFMFDFNNASTEFYKRYKKTKFYIIASSRTRLYIKRNPITVELNVKGFTWTSNKCSNLVSEQTNIVYLKHLTSVFSGFI